MRRRRLLLALVPVALAIGLSHPAGASSTPFLCYANGPLHIGTCMYVPG